MSDQRIPLPSDCAVCDYPQWMHEEGEFREGCDYLAPGVELRKQRLVARRAANQAAQHG